MLDLYQRVSTHLSVASASPDPRSSPTCPRCWRGRGGSAGARTSTWADVLAFFTRTFPPRCTAPWWWGSTAVASVVLAALTAWWADRPPGGPDQPDDPAEIEAYVGTDFENYYREFPHPEFATMLVWSTTPGSRRCASSWGARPAGACGCSSTNIVSVGHRGADGHATTGARSSSD